MSSSTEEGQLQFTFKRIRDPDIVGKYFFGVIETDESTNVKVETSYELTVTDSTPQVVVPEQGEETEVEEIPEE